MMEGIEVLNKIEITSAPTWLLILTIAIAVIEIFLAIVQSLLPDKEYLIVITMIFLVLSFTGILSTAIIQEPTGEYEYEVTIDDNVNLKEFISKYEIIRQKEKIYVIKEK